MKPLIDFRSWPPTNARTWTAGLRFETLDHGGRISDTMPQAINSSMPKAAPAFTLRSRRTER